MQSPVAIENIEELRRREGIDDVELRKAIRSLAVGDFVWLTFLSNKESTSGETILVQITRMRGSALQGRLAKRPLSKSLASLKVGAPVAFTTAHIHSLPRVQPPDAQ